MPDKDFEIISQNPTNTVVAQGHSLEETLIEFNKYDPQHEFGFLVVEYHNYRKIPLFECSTADETRIKICEKIGQFY